MESKMQFIFCYECNKESETDKRYVMDLIRQCYRSKPNIYPVFMGGIGNYKSARVVGEIKGHRKFLRLQNPNVMTKVIYFIDSDAEMDRIDIINEKRLNNIKEYCREYGYDLVIFVKEVEDVFRVVTTRKAKVRNSKNFLQDEKRYDRIKRSDLYKIRPIKSGESNILAVLDQYLK